MMTSRIIALAFFLLVLPIGCAGLTPPPTALPVPTPTTDVKIVYPSDGAHVDQTETIKGNSQKLPVGQAVWVVLFVPSAGRFYPQNFPADMQANGDWASVAFIGIPKDTGLKFDIIAVLADKDAQTAFNLYLQTARDKQDSPGLEQLPKGAVIYDRKTTVRK